MQRLSTLPSLPTQLNEADSNDIDVSYTDQQSINAFSRYNSRLSDIEDQLRSKKEEKEALDEIALELELVDEDEEVLYKLSDSFIHIPQSRALEYLERDTKRVDEEIDQLKSTVDEYEEEMKKLKVLLYGKFGNNISECHDHLHGGGESHTCIADCFPFRTYSPRPRKGLIFFSVGSSSKYNHL